MTKPTILVTGGNRGLGLETCRQLARSGSRVILTSRREDGAEQASRMAAEGRAVDHARLDVADDASVRALAGRLAHEDTTIHALVNNAGISMAGFDAEVARRTLDVNFFGALRVTDALLPLIPAGGCVVMVSSAMGELSCVSAALRARLLDPALTRDDLVDLMRSFVESVRRGDHGRHGWPSSAYSVSKVGMNALTRILARDLQARGVRVNAICPGWARTDMGGRGAPRSVETGAASIVWGVEQGLREEGPSGGFYRDGRALQW